MKALKKRVLAKRAQAAAEEELAEARGTTADGPEDATPAVVGPRATRRRPSGKRR
jgi:preprotein translocase subunit SecF